jgi:hypothetical protein
MFRSVALAVAVGLALIGCSPEGAVCEVAGSSAGCCSGASCALVCGDEPSSSGRRLVCQRKCSAAADCGAGESCAALASGGSVRRCVRAAP